MKRWISMITVMTLLLGLCACSNKGSDSLLEDASLSDALSEAASASSEAVEAVSTPSEAAQSASMPSEASAAVSASSKAATAVPGSTDASTSSPTSKEGVSAAPKQGMTVDMETSDACITLDETQTKYGLIQIPQINESMLDSDDVRLANEMFLSIRDRVLEGIEDLDEELGDETFIDASKSLCVTKYTQNDSLLSIMVKYTELYPYSTAMEYYEAVNIDVSTGKALNHHEVINAAGFTEDEVRTALRSYADRSMFHEWESMTFYDCAAEGTIPDGLGDPSYMWQEDLDELVAGYDAPAPSQGEPWDALPRYPAVYLDEVGLEVCVSVPTAAGGGSYDTMVRIGHNDTETRLLNPSNPYGQPFGRGAMMTSAAYEVVAQSVELDYAYSGNVQYKISAESMEIIEVDGQFDPAYVFRVYTDEGDHIATAGWYAVGVFSGTMWTMDITSGQWIHMMNGTGLLPEEIYTGADMNGALAVIWNEPGDYGFWAANPCAEVDLIAYGSNSNHYISNGETFLLFAIEDGTSVSFDSGTMNGDVFVPQSQLCSMTLNAGDSVLVYVIRPEGMPTQAITVSTESDAGNCVLWYDGMEGTPEFSYVTSFSSVG